MELKLFSHTRFFALPNGDCANEKSIREQVLEPTLICSPQHHRLFFQRPLYVNQALVATSAEAELLVAQALDEGAIHQYVDLLQESPLGRHGEQSLVGVSCVTPDSLCTLLPDGTGQLGETFRLHHGIASRKGHISKGVGQDGTEKFFGSHGMSGMDIP